MSDRTRNLALIDELAAPQLPDRPVITDDGVTTLLTIYRDRDAIARIELTPQHSLTLARRLLDAAASRFRHQEED